MQDNGTVVVKESEYPFESGDGKSHACKQNLYVWSQRF